MLGGSQDQENIQYILTWKPLDLQMNSINLVIEVKTLGAVESPVEKPSSEKVLVAKQTIKIMIMLNNRNS